jgi:ferredoxin
MAKYKIIYDRKACIGCDACVSVCPENWELVERNGEMKAKPKKLEISEEEYSSNSEAADNCPVECIKIEKIKTRKKQSEEDEEDFEDDEEID